MKHLALLAALVLAAAACGDNLVEQAQPDAGLSEAPSDPGPGDDVGSDEEEPVDEEEEDSGLACTVDELLPLLECAFENCLLGDLGDFDPGEFLPGGEGGGLPGGEGGGLPGLPGLPGGDGGSGLDLDGLLACTVSNCALELLSVSSECTQCILGGLGGDVEDLVDICGGDLGGGLPGGGGGGGGLPGGFPGFP